MAILGAVSISIFSVLSVVVSDPSFDVFSTDFVALFKDLTNAIIVASFSSGSAYILKNLLTDDDQNFLGIRTET